jgi:hypothetical protein
MIRTFLIYLRYFWPVIPAFTVALGTGWLFWGMAPWIAVMLSAAAGLAVFGFFAFVAAWTS